MFFVATGFLAALLIFSFLFVCLGVVALILFCLDLPGGRTGRAEFLRDGASRLRRVPGVRHHSLGCPYLHTIPVRHWYVAKYTNFFSITASSALGRQNAFIKCRNP